MENIKVKIYYALDEDDKIVFDFESMQAEFDKKINQLVENNK